MLVTVDRYQAITADTSPTAAVESALTDAQLLLEERLGRPLEQDERTERVKMFTERRGIAVYPAALPLISVTDPSGAGIEGAAFVGGSPLGWADLAWGGGYRDVTYVGGYDPAETDPNEPDFLPRTLERAIAWAAYAELNRSDVVASIPVGVTSARVGDVALTWGGDGIGSAGEVRFPDSIIRRYRRRRDIAA